MLVFQRKDNSKNKQIGPNQTHKLLYSIGNHKQVKRQPTDCKICNQKGLNFQNIQIAYNSITKKQVKKGQKT